MQGVIDYGTGNTEMDSLRGRIASFLFVSGSSQIIFIFGLVFINSIVLLMKLPLSPLGFLSLIGVLFWLRLTSKEYFPIKQLSMFMIQVILFIMILLFSLYLSGRIYDLSPDGQTYHQEAIDRLANGWNPVWNYEKDNIDERLTYYPKGPWIYAASFFQITKNMEYSKLFNITLIISTFCLILSFLLKGTNMKWGFVLILSLLASLNPVNILQASSFYVDGHLSSLLTIVFGLTIYYTYTKEVIPPLFLLACSVMLLINLKATGMVYAGILIFGILSVFYLFRKTDRDRLVLIFGTAVFSFIVGITILGFNPYINNILSHQNPLYPIGAKYWPGTNTSPVDLIEIGMPENWHSYNRFEKLFATIFSESAVAWSGRWKLPFTFETDELMNFAQTDVRVAGFGPLFGGAIVLSIISLILILIFNRTTFAVLSMLIILLLVASVLSNPIAWYARYAPQLWLFPVLCIGLCFYFRPTKLLSSIGFVIALVLTLNIALISAVRFAAVLEDNHQFKGQLNYIKSLDRPVKVYFSNFYANRIRFNDMKIISTEMSRDELVICKNTIALVSTETVVCLD